MRVDQPVRPPQPHRQLPALATARCLHARLIDPAQQHAGWWRHSGGRRWRLAIGQHLGRIGLKRKPPAQCGGLWQPSNLSGQLQAAPFQLCRQDARLPGRCTPTRAAPSQRGQRERPAQQQAAQCPGLFKHTLPATHKNSSHQTNENKRQGTQKHVNISRPQHRLLQLPRHAQHPGQQAADPQSCRYLRQFAPRHTQPSVAPAHACTHNCVVNLSACKLARDIYMAHYLLSA